MRLHRVLHELIGLRVVSALVLDAPVVDPITTAAAAAGKSLGQAAAKQVFVPSVGIGSPQERREVYQRFSERATRCLMLSQQVHALRVQPWYAIHIIAWSRLPRELLEAYADLMSSYQEVHLVSGPEMLAAADEVLTSSSPLPTLAVDRKGSDAFHAAANDLAAGLRRFTLAAREDLAYEPRRWQIWRTIPRWWKGRSDRKALKAERVAGALEPPGK